MASLKMTSLFYVEPGKAVSGVMICRIRFAERQQVALLFIVFHERCA